MKEPIMFEDPGRFDAIVDSPVGPVGIRMSGDALAELGFPPAGTPAREPASAAAARVLVHLRAYFEDPAADLRVPMTQAGTAFQRRVWQALCRIPAGQVRTYGELAGELGTAPRAVGGACRANPRPILVPCHRVVAAHGKGGYAGETTGRWMAIKEQLLRLEGVDWPT
jgi:methylated-DNA-[protein]-cysteine S-methyltransferase